MKSCPGLEQADYRDNEGLGCCRVIAAPLQDSAFFFLLPQTPGTRSHFSIRHCSSQQEPKLAKRAHFTTCMCDLANLLLCVCVCVSEAAVRDTTADSHYPSVAAERSVMNSASDAIVSSTQRGNHMTEPIATNTMPPPTSSTPRGPIKGVEVASRMETSITSI